MAGNKSLTGAPAGPSGEGPVSSLVELDDLGVIRLARLARAVAQAQRIGQQAIPKDFCYASQCSSKRELPARALDRHRADQAFPIPVSW